MLQLEKCAATADESYLKDGIIWKYLEAICRALKLKEQAEHYASLARPSWTNAVAAFVRFRVRPPGA